MQPWTWPTASWSTWRAIRKSHVDPVIKFSPGGWALRVVENAEHIAVARALLHSHPLCDTIWIIQTAYLGFAANVNVKRLVTINDTQRHIFQWREIICNTIDGSPTLLFDWCGWLGWLTSLVTCEAGGKLILVVARALRVCNFPTVIRWGYDIRVAHKRCDQLARRSIGTIRGRAILKSQINSCARNLPRLRA